MSIAGRCRLSGWREKLGYAGATMRGSKWGNWGLIPLQLCKHSHPPCQGLVQCCLVFHCGSVSLSAEVYVRHDVSLCPDSSALVPLPKCLMVTDTSACLTDTSASSALVLTLTLRQCRNVLGPKFPGSEVS